MLALSHALVGEQLHVLCMLLEHATQKGTFLLPRLPFSLKDAALSFISRTFAREHLAQQLFRLARGRTGMLGGRVLFLCDVARRVAPTWNAQGPVHAFELGRVDQVAPELVTRRGQMSLLDRAIDRRAMLADELGGLDRGQECHVASLRKATSRDVSRDIGVAGRATQCNW